jgi:starch-binding outer membrane protein, SusD/RagB family
MNKLDRNLVLASVIASVAALLGGACGDLDEPGLPSSPTRASVAAAAVAPLIAMRDEMAAPNGYISLLGILGRESYNFDGSDPRYITELLEGPLDAGNRGFGGHFWETPYRNIRAGHILLGAVGATPGMEMAEMEAVRGFTKTIMALEYLRVINTRDINGAVIQVSSDPRALDPIVDMLSVFNHMNALLDEARMHLLGGGTAFPFALGGGFSGFDTPRTFLKFNRALKARVNLYIEDHAAVLTALSESFISADPAMPNLGLGIYLTFESGAQSNPLGSPSIFVHPSVRQMAELRPDGEIDARVGAKVAKVTERTVRELRSDEAFTLYRSPIAPIPIIRNEELILIRAESSAVVGDLAQGARDINFIREHSGRLATRADLTTKALIDDEVLRQRFYSLLFEGGHRWLDMRRYSRLDRLPNDHPQATAEVPAHVVHARFPIPLDEAAARTPDPN